MADVASALRSWSATAGSNSPSGSTVIGAGLDDNLRTIQAVVRQYLASTASNMASAATVDLSTADGFYVNITGGTTITSFGTESAGVHYVIKFASALTLTHNATSLILPGGANITTVAGDIAWMMSEGSGNWRCLHYSGTGTTSQQGVLELATTAEVQAGTDTARAVTPAGLRGGFTVIGTAASATGTVVAYSSIPSWVTEIDCHFSGVSSTSTGHILVQIGTGGVATTSGYSSASCAVAQTNTVVGTSSTAGFCIYTGVAGDIFTGRMTLRKMTGNQWTATHAGTKSGYVSSGGGDVTLGGTLDYLRFLNTTGDFDAGTVNITYR